MLLTWISTLGAFAIASFVAAVGEHSVWFFLLSGIFLIGALVLTAYGMREGINAFAYRCLMRWIERQEALSRTHRQP